MPAISEKLKLETANSQTVRLWPEGTFYKVYERSAYLFVTRLRPYEVKRRYVDKVGGDVEQQEEKVYRFYGIVGTPDMSLVSDPKPKAKQEPLANAQTEIENPVISALLSFDLSMSTPMDAMNLISTLQKQLRASANNQ